MDVIKTSADVGNSPKLPPVLQLAMDGVIDRVSPGLYRYR